MGLADAYPDIWTPIGDHGGRITEDWSHRAIHSGEIYRSGTFEVIGAGSSLSVMMTTSTSQNVHLTLSTNTNGPGLARFYEGPVASSGTTITAKNANRNVTTTSDTILVKDPTVATVGTSIGISVIGSTGFKEVSGGDAVSQVWLLKPSTNYLMRFTADAASCRTVLKMIWLED